MAKTTAAPKVYNIDSAANAVGCASRTLRAYIRSGLLDVARTPAGHAVLFPTDVEKARRLFERNTRYKNGR